MSWAEPDGLTKAVTEECKSMALQAQGLQVVTVTILSSFRPGSPNGVIRVLVQLRHQPP
jgi:hypothetical protein